MLACVRICERCNHVCEADRPKLFYITGNAHVLGKMKVKSGKPTVSRENLLSDSNYWTGIYYDKASQHRGVSMGIGGTN